MKVHSYRSCLPCMALTAVLLPGALAQAAIIGMTGAVVSIPAPANVSFGIVESDTQIGVFPEQQNIILDQDINVNITIPGTSPGATNNNFSAGIITAGTAVQSYYAHYDVVGAPSPQNAIPASGSITFDTDVLGLIVLPPTLSNSDAELGLVSTIYDPTNAGLEITVGGVGQDANDQIILSADRRTVTLNLRDADTADDVRIVTAAVPEPTSIALLLGGGVGVFARRRRRHHA